MAMDLSRISLRSVTGEGVGDLPEFQVPPADPLELAAAWISRAIERGVREAGTFALATADGHGAPSCRYMLLKGFDSRGLLWVSQSVSEKGSDIAANPRAAAAFYWQELRQQLRLSGAVAPVDPAESDDLFAVRPIGAKAGSAVSHQSGELADENAFATEVQRLVAAGRPIDRPDRWTGYRLVPDRIEFWQGEPQRLHHRLEYRRRDTSWRHRLLQP